jgi:hypothetical protein
VIGNLKRRGPALPGFRYMTPERSVRLGLCECPLTTMLNSAGGRIEVKLLNIVQDVYQGGAGSALAVVKTFRQPALILKDLSQRMRPNC